MVGRTRHVGQQRSGLDTGVRLWYTHGSPLCLVIWVVANPVYHQQEGFAVVKVQFSDFGNDLPSGCTKLTLVSRDGCAPATNQATRSTQGWQLRRLDEWLSRMTAAPWQSALTMGLSATRDVGVWVVTTADCNYAYPVWCIED